MQNEWGFEVYYNIALTPWLLLTPDVQVLGPAQKREIVNLRDQQRIGNRDGLRGARTDRILEIVCRRATPW